MCELLVSVEAFFGNSLVFQLLLPKDVGLSYFTKNTQISSILISILRGTSVYESKIPFMGFRCTIPSEKSKQEIVNQI